MLGILRRVAQAAKSRPSRKKVRTPHRGLQCERLESRAMLAAVADLTAFRPVHTQLNYLLYPVAESVEEDTKQGPGIRVNGDDDNANGVRDFLDSSPLTAADRDLIRVNTSGSGTSFNLSWTGNLAVWKSDTKSAPVANGGSIVAGDTVWVEYTSDTHTVGNSATMTFVASDGIATATDRLVFHSFQSIVVAIGGNTQDPTKVGDPNLGTFTMGRTLYTKGYDAYLFAHDQIQSTGRGAAYDEVVNAVLKRNVDNVAIFGYSWGGGATYELSVGLAANASLATAGYKLQYTAYVDAIRHGSITAETRKPASTALHDNYFQRRDLLLRGSSVTGANNVNVNKTTWGSSLVHGTIDDHPTLQTLIVDKLITRLALA